MPRTEIPYSEARPLMGPGDVIAFSGRGWFSDSIRAATASNVSHVGIVLQSYLRIDGEPHGEFYNQIIESTRLDGFSGVIINRFSTRLDQYDGEIWWLPLREEVRQRMDQSTYYEFILRQERKPYDLPQAIWSAVDVGGVVGWLRRIPGLGNLGRNREQFDRLFCSELAAGALSDCGVIGQINAAEVTPSDLCSFRIYRDDYAQLKGVPREIGEFNSGPVAVAS